MLTIVTRQNLFAEKTRLAISIGGVAFAVFLISLLLALYQGWRTTSDGSLKAWMPTSG